LARPRGATIAALLAGRGRDVVLIRKSRHPRFHIGEIAIAAHMPLFERLGVADESKRSACPSMAAEFVSPWHPAAVLIRQCVDKSFEGVPGSAARVRPYFVSQSTRKGAAP